MPLYLYRCKKCGSQEEHLQKFSDPPPSTCESCGGGLEKMLTPAAFHLKGGGWYKDGYASAKADAGDSGAKSDGNTSGADSTSTAAGDKKSGETKSSETKSSDKKPAEKKSGGAKAAGE